MVTQLFGNVASGWFQQHSSELQVAAIIFREKHGQSPVPGMLINLLDTGHVA